MELQEILVLTAEVSNVFWEVSSSLGDWKEESSVTSTNAHYRLEFLSTDILFSPCLLIQNVSFESVTAVQPKYLCLGTQCNLWWGLPDSWISFPPLASLRAGGTLVCKLWVGVEVLMIWKWSLEKAGFGQGNGPHWTFTTGTPLFKSVMFSRKTDPRTLEISWEITRTHLEVGNPGDTWEVREL